MSAQDYDRPLFDVPAPAPAVLELAPENATTALYEDGRASSNWAAEEETRDRAENPLPVLATDPTLAGWWSLGTTEVTRMVWQVKADTEADAVAKLDRLQRRVVGGNLAARTVEYAAAIGPHDQAPPHRWLTGPRVIARARREGASALGVYPAPAGGGATPWPGKGREPTAGALAEVTVELVERDGALVIDVLVEATGGLPVHVRTSGPVNA